MFRCKNDLFSPISEVSYRNPSYLCRVDGLFKSLLINIFLKPPCTCNYYT